ncbi:hypothetical protein INR49_015849 [Caranx melampygus]|nr:hypothetical protein INR49_015849 [Caranx melampygus]
MKYHFIVLSCLLLVWTLTVFVSCGDTAKTEITVATVSDGIKVKCSNGHKLRKSGTNDDKGKQERQLDYRDENSGEYECFKDGDSGQDPEPKIFVKFRTCDNCIELDIAAIMGIVIGDLVATIGVGFGVYLIAAHGRSGPPAPSRNKGIHPSIPPSLHSSLHPSSMKIL